MLGCDYMRALVVYNNFSGRSKASKRLDYVCEMLKTKYEVVECFASCGPKSITSYIASCGYSFDFILAIGGDGSVHEAINGIMMLEKKPKIAYIPTGTCNDSAKTLGLGKNIKKTMKKIIEGNSSKLDVFKINDSYFVYGLAAGMLTEISYDASHESKKNMGKLAYYLQGLKAYKDTKTITVRVETESKRIEGSFSMLLALNTRYLAGFKIHRKRRIYLDDGTLRVTMIKKTRKLYNLVDFAMFLILGELYTHNMIYFDAKSIDITSASPIDFNTDGEFYGTFNTTHVEIIPHAIDIVLSERVLKRHFHQKS